MCVEADMSRRAVLQSVSARERYDSQKDSGFDRTGGHTRGAPGSTVALFQSWRYGER